ncbi:extracellular solute-binding protein [Cohnella hashimotonis]|uniref:Extracellular solute-binding protein n=1 Tax=Cohnella hashimotonis TaxID=2826895 RepID=A0ABT6TDC3_9BACL|nr:extracellular solute-binding protein [Cohnella hashimotonis]MDI4644335.1 extracellular solute-binding protein [Cohnella hashimotonis]
MAKRLAALVLVLLLAGCGSPRFIDGPLPGGAAPQAREEIVIWHTYSDEETRIFENEVIPAFEKAYPGIHVTPVRQPYSLELKSTIIARSTSGKTPDLVRMDITWVPELSSLGVLYPVGDLPDFKAAAARLQSVTMDTNKFKDRYYGLPLDVNTRVAIYNREKLERLGIDPPRTVDELVQAARKAKLPLGLDGPSLWSLLPYFYGMGGRLMDPAYSRAGGYLNSPASIAALSRIAALTDEGVFDRNLILGRGDRWEAVLKGNMLMADDGPWFYSVLSTSQENKFDLKNDTMVTPFPGRSVIGGENLVILRDTPHLQAAWTFMKWMTGKEAQQTMFEAGQLPTNREAGMSASVDGNAFVAATMQGVKDAMLRPPIPDDLEIEDLFTKYMLLVFTKKLTVSEGLNQAAAAIDAVVSAK